MHGRILPFVSRVSGDIHACRERVQQQLYFTTREVSMSTTHRKLKKANHGKRPACKAARRAKRKMIKT